MCSAAKFQNRIQIGVRFEQHAVQGHVASENFECLDAISCRTEAGLKHTFPVFI